ncbi:hypothetical protein [uncultured Bacteroides sp.]|uniref:hypothetical protein n=1 Tax=uncultured Bacteroides sp. TaxID=162156 RepID=UPI002AAC3385|nr:hypothetical protein [uncultured Bacteroides sp.]
MGLLNRDRIAIKNIAFCQTNDSKKFKNRQQALIILFFLFLFPSLVFAQYRTGMYYDVSFKNYENQYGTLEHKEDSLIFKFVPSDRFWKVSITNHSTGIIMVDWANAQFIISGRASGITSPNIDDESQIEDTIYIKEQATISKEILPAILQNKGKIFNAKRLKHKGQKSYATIVLPIKMDQDPKKYFTFDFKIECKR